MVLCCHLILWCLCGGVVVGGGQNVPGYNMVYDTRYSLAQLRYGGWRAGWEIGRGGKAGIWVAHARSNVKVSRGQVNVKVFGNKIHCVTMFLYYPSLSCRKSTLRFGNTNRHAIHTHQEGGGVISNKICYLLLSNIIQIPEGIYRVSLKICCT